MKRLIYLFIFTLFVTSCTGYRTSSSGIENKGYINIVGNTSVYKNVIVTIDEKNSFETKVNKEHATIPKGNILEVSTGSHIIQVHHKGNLIFQKKVLISNGQTRKIVLQ